MKQSLLCLMLGIIVMGIMGMVGLCEDPASVDKTGVSGHDLSSVAIDESDKDAIDDLTYSGLEIPFDDLAS